MEIHLTKKPKGIILVNGFPGIGLVGTIVTKFLLDKLEFEKIGNIYSEELMPIIAVHKSKIVEPLGIFYNKKYNLVILQSLTGIQGLEWQMAAKIIELAKMLEAKEIVNIDSVPSSQGELKSFYYTTNESRKKDFEKKGIAPLEDAIISGVSSALILKAKIPISCIVAQTHFSLPDSEAAAHVVEVFDKVWGMDLDYKPLLVAAKKFETQLKTLIEKSKMGVAPSAEIPKEEAKKEELDYLG